MSNLYIRVKTSFYTHRKTVKLRIKLGPDAFWIPPRLWAYAAENQPDGDLSAYSSEELAELLGCPSYAKVMLQALRDSGFVDESGKIHDWDEHNGYHEKFANRAKLAAAARWEKARAKKSASSPTPPPLETGNRKQESGDKHCLSDATSMGGGKFVKPTIPEVESECLRIGLPADQASQFFFHFESNGWKVGGKAAMKSWHAALQTWKHRHKNDSTFGARPVGINGVGKSMELDRATKELNNLGRLNDYPKGSEKFNRILELRAAIPELRKATGAVA